MDIDRKNVSDLIASGQYFDEARNFYALKYHEPISARSYYVVVILLGLIVLWISISSFMSVFPISPKIPFVLMSNDVYEELPVMEKLAKGEEPKNEAVMRFLVRNYVERREFYNFFKPANMETNFYNLRFHSTRDVLLQYREFLQTSNPSSPYNVYGRDTSRTIRVTSMLLSRTQSADGSKAERYNAQIEFSEKLSGSKQSISPDWVANVEFTYEPFQVEQDVEELSMTNFFSIALDVYNHPEKYPREGKFKIKPMTFVVSSYTTRPKLVEQ